MNVVVAVRQIKMKNKYLIYLVIVLVLVITFFYFYEYDNKSETKLVNVEEFNNLIKDEGVFVINTHTPYEGEIDGTDLIAEDWENIDVYLDKLPKDKNTIIAVYCRSGRMSASSSNQLVELGYNNVYDLNGGMNAWKSSGRNLVFNN